MQYRSNMSFPWFHALLGGLMIGAASALVLVAHGRIAGISGVVGSLLSPATGDRDWRLAFVGGLVASGIVAAFVAPQAVGASVRSLPVLAIAGVLVGFGTQLGGGCTSGHGVCGVSRLSPRSLVAVGTFMMTGALTTLIVGGVS